MCENQLPGTPQSRWDISPIGGTDNIRGFADGVSVDHGQTVNFKIDTDASAYHVDIYRMGYYAGNGARLVTTIRPSARLPQTQPKCSADAPTGLVDCGDWAVSASWAVPASAVSGIYVADLIRDDGTAGASQLSFVVRDDERHADVVFENANATEQAYNAYGGNSLYVGQNGPGPKKRAYAVSFNRPVASGSSLTRSRILFSYEYPMIRWMEANGYDVSYISDLDTQRLGVGLLAQHKVYLAVGHDEYVSAQQRAAITGALAKGVSLGFFTGNDVAWKTRFGPSIDGSATPNRTMYCYKESSTVIDPSGVWTGHWGDKHFPALNPGQVNTALTGQGWWVVMPTTTSFPITVPSGYSHLRFWRNTSVAATPPGHLAVLTNGVLGYEWDSDNDVGGEPPGQPSGLIEMSATTPSFGTGKAQHHLTLYRARSGALVFGAGTIQWSWGLDGTHDGGATVPDVSMQQATVNLLADMKVRSGALQPGLVPAVASTDTISPASSIAQPAPGSNLAVGRATVISVTATDTGGGVVAGVEVSVDNGATWRSAEGFGPWTLAFTPKHTGTTTIRSRAVDDSGNIEQPTAGITVTVS